MQNNLEIIGNQKNILYAVIAIAVVGLIANGINDEIGNLIVANLSYFPIAGSFMILSFLIVKKYGVKGDHGKAWILLAVFATVWFMAETLWTVYDLVLDIDPYPSMADFFFLLGYPFLFAFTIFYLKPVRNLITKKILGIAILASTTLFIPTIYLTMIVEEIDNSTEINEVLLASSYPIADAFVFVPAIIGVTLFFKGRVNFLWTLFLIGIILTAIGDTLFLSTYLNEDYYGGHILEIIFLWAYLMFGFGVKSHLNMFKNKKK